MVGSEEHNELTARAGTWFGARATKSGIRGSHELMIRDKYIADYVALGSFQDRFQDAYFINSKRKRPAFHLGERMPADEILWTVIGYWLCVFESKISRSDFQSTFTRGITRHEPAGNMHWLITPKGMLSDDEVPEDWGLLEKSGNGLRERRMTRICDVDNNHIRMIAHRMLWKR